MREHCLKILVMGGSGMLGHRIWIELDRVHETTGTLRSPDPLLHKFFTKEPNVILNVTVDNFVHALEKDNYDVVINCIGIIKHIPEASSHIESIKTNSLFPHQLAYECQKRNIRLIHFSTDCVFDGIEGSSFSEGDKPIGSDLYGSSKILGEIDYLENVVSIRTSLIGREVRTCSSLVEWFLSQNGTKVLGFKNAVFSGLSTNSIARIIEKYILPNPKLSGIYHLSVDPISKLDLLQLIKNDMDLDIDISPTEEPHINRALCSKKLISETGYIPPKWDEMIKELSTQDQTYREIHKSR
jgi:dTDP-4-dehydrorhamnose reductase